MDEPYLIFCSCLFYVGIFSSPSSIVSKIHSRPEINVFKLRWACVIKRQLPLSGALSDWVRWLIQHFILGLPIEENGTSGKFKQHISDENWEEGDCLPEWIRKEIEIAELWALSLVNWSCQPGMEHSHMDETPRTRNIFHSGLSWWCSSSNTMEVGGLSFCNFWLSHCSLKNCFASCFWRWFATAIFSITAI